MPTDQTFPVPLPPGLRARRADLDADRAGVIELVRAIDVAYVGRPSQPPEQVVADVEESEDLATDVWVVTAGDRIVGLGWFVVENPEPPRSVLWFEVYVAPDLDAGGLEGALVEAMLDRARRWPRSPGTEALLVESGCRQADTRTSEPAGFVLGDASRSAENGGYVRTLGVMRDVRGRGIGRHLLQVVFAEQAHRGWTWSQLTVDTGNATGAPKLYASAGMEPVEVIDLYRAVLADDGSPAPGTRVVS